MEIISRRFRQPMVALTPGEMDRIDWQTVRQGCIYLDLHGNTHIELGHQGYLPFFHNTSWWDLVVRQDRFYAKLTDRILAACKTKPASDLIGARQFLIIPGCRWIISTALALRSRDSLHADGLYDRNPQIDATRQHAHTQLVEIFDDIAARIDAPCALTATSEIPVERMARHGWRHVEQPKTWVRWLHRLSAFPLRNQRLFVREYRPTQLEGAAVPKLVTAGM